MKYLYFIFLILFSCKSDLKQSENTNSLNGEIAKIVNSDFVEKKREIKKPEKNKRKYGGEVKRVVEYWCDELLPNENPWKIDKESCEVYIIEEYNKNEIQSKRIVWSLVGDDRDPWQIKTVRINDAGLIIEDNTESKDWSTGNYKPNTRVSYSYNSAGFETEKIVNLYGKFDFREEKIYDDYNCVIKETNYDKDNKMRYTFVMEYDDLNRKISSKTYDSKNELKNSSTYEYKDESKEWSARYFNNNGKIEKEVKKEELAIEYHSNGSIKYRHSNNNYNQDVYQHFDRLGRIEKTEIHNKEKWLDTYTWKYREDGAVIEESESTATKPGLAYYKETTFYKVDFNGNWIEKYSLDSEGNLTERQVREIEYY